MSPIGAADPIDHVIKHQANHGNFAKPAHLIRDDDPGRPEDEPTIEPPAAKRTRRARKPTT